MKPQLLKVSTGAVQSFSVRQDKVPYNNNRWHYHPEVELIHFEQGTGTQFIGDSITKFDSGDIVLIGSGLAHYWRFDDAYFDIDAKVTANVTVAHFCENFWGEQFLNIPENRIIKDLLEKAKLGISITGKTREKVAGLLAAMFQSEGPRRLIILMEALFEIASCQDLKPLSSIGFRHDFEKFESERINAIYEYSLANFKRKIHLDEIASVARISPNSFCRYFKTRTGKTYSQMLTEIKIGYACKLLIDNQLSIKQVCYDSGFNNFASFHKYFRNLTGKSPLKYQKEFVKASPAGRY